MPVIVCIQVYIQGVSRLVDITAGGDFLGICDKKSSYIYMCPILTVTELWAFFNSSSRPRVNRVLRNYHECGAGGVGGYSPGQCIPP
jgi:hypothetical protein